MSIHIPTPKNQLVVEYRATSSLKPDPRNARTHSGRQIEQIMGSITEFGFANPILTDPDGVIIAGHGRLRAAKNLQMGEVPTITLEGLSEGQKRALRLADNKIALNAGWDMDLLKGALLDLSVPELEFDPSLMGFSVGEIDVILDDGVDPDDEVIHAVPSEPEARLGDIWDLGDHRIGCGGARDLEFLQEIVGPDQRADAALVLSRLRSGLSSHLGGLSFECHALPGSGLCNKP